MAQRYFLINNSETIGLYYQEENHKMTIGGNRRFYELMITVMEEYFKIKKYEIVKTQKNKVKLITRLWRDALFFDGIRKLKNDGLTLQQTKTFNRIWW